MFETLALEIDFPVFNCISSFYNLLRDFGYLLISGVISSYILLKRGVYQKIEIRISTNVIGRHQIRTGFIIVPK